MTEHDKVEALRVLVKAANDDRRVRTDNWGIVERDDPYYLIPKGIWDDIVAKADEAVAG